MQGFLRFCGKVRISPIVGLGIIAGSAFSVMMFAFVQVSVLENTPYAQGAVLSAIDGCSYYAAPNGSPTADGINSPWDLQTALEKPADLLAGRTLCLNQGVYRGNFTLPDDSNFAVPFTVRSTPNQWAILDAYLEGKLLTAMPVSEPWKEIPCDIQFNSLVPNKSYLSIEGESMTVIRRDGKLYCQRRGTGLGGTVIASHPAGAVVFTAGNALSVAGSNSIWRDFEITDTNWRRYIPNFYTVLGKGSGMSSYGVKNKFINLVIHDTVSNVGLWSDGFGTRPSDTEFFGNIVYNGGVMSDDREHGHSLYIQNKVGSKLTKYNFLFNAFGYGIHGYTQKGATDKLEFEGNTVFGSGVLGRYSTSNILMGGVEPTFRKNYTYPSRDISFNCDSDGVWEDNYFVENITATNCKFKTFQRNTLVGNFRYDVTNASGTVTTMTPPPNPPVDATNVFYKTTSPTQNRVFVHKASYLSSDPVRLYITIYNWTNGPSTSVDPGLYGLPLGSYEVRDVQNVHEVITPIGSTYTGGAINLPTLNAASKVEGPLVPAGVPFTAGGFPAWKAAQHTSERFQTFIVCQRSCFNGAIGKIATPVVAQPVTTDIIAPLFSVTTPTPSNATGYIRYANPTANNGYFNVSGTASDAGGVRDVVWARVLDGTRDEVYGTASGTTNWSAKIPLKAGTNFIMFMVRDNTGNANGVVYEVTSTISAPTSDTIKPSVLIGAPTNNASVGVPNITVSGTASDNTSVAGVSLTLNGTPVAVTGTTAWSAAVTALKQGANTIVATARDAAGNTQSASSIVIYDATAPSITIDAPANNSVFTTSSVNITGIASDNINVTQVTWSSSAGAIGTAAGTIKWSAGVPLAVGTNLITFTARDAVGKSSSASITITRPPLQVTDTEAPKVWITGPVTTNNIYNTTTARVTVNGGTSDNVGVTEVTWATDRGLGGTAAGTANWSASFDAPVGLTSITVNAKDAKGNASQANIKVNYQPAEEGTGGSTNIPRTACPAPGVGVYTACYYAGIDLNAANLKATGQANNPLNFNWGSAAPATNVPIDQFSARFEGDFTFESGEYDFKTISDDGVRVYVDGVLLVDYWTTHGASPSDRSKIMTAGTHRIKVEYFDGGGWAVLQSWWVKKTTTITPPPAPAPSFAQYFEAEKAQLVAPMAPVSSSTASGGVFVTSPTSGQGKAVFTVNAPAAGTYYLFALVNVQTLTGVDDSFYVATGTGETGADIFDTADENRNWGKGWTWVSLIGRGCVGLNIDDSAIASKEGANCKGLFTLKPRRLSLVAGNNTIQFRTRDANSRLDGIFVSSDPNVVPTANPTVVQPVSDTQPPKLTLTAPISNFGGKFETGATKVTISGTATDDVGVTSVSISVNGVKVPVTGIASWLAVVDVVAGDNAVSISAADASGKSIVGGIVITYKSSFTVEAEAAVLNETGIAGYTPTSPGMSLSLDKTYIMFDVDPAAANRDIDCTGKGGSAKISFNVADPSKSMYMWAYVLSDNSDTDSFCYVVDSNFSAKRTFDTSENYWNKTGWKWVRVVNREDNGGAVISQANPVTAKPAVFSFTTAGQHTITFLGRDPRTKLDKIFITQNPTEVPN
jgi:hypothetical protein